MRPERPVKLFQRAQRSLFGEILDWMLTPLLLLGPVSLGVTWLVAQGIANAPFDRALRIQRADARAAGRPCRTGASQFNAAAAGARDPARRRRRPRLLPGAGRPTASCSAANATCPCPGTDEPPAPGVVYLRDGEMHGKAVRVASLWVAGAHAGRAAGAGAGGRDAREAVGARHRDHQGRAAAAVRDPAAGGAADLAGAGARHQAAVGSGGAHPRAQARRPEPARRVRRAAGGGAAGVCRSTTC